MEGLASVAVSRDGESLYAVSWLADAVLHFQKDPESGMLAYADCFSTDPTTVGCTDLSATTGGLEEAFSLRLSPDDTSLYVAAYGADAISHFRRDPETGQLTFAGCWTSGSTLGCTDVDRSEQQNVALFQVAAVAVSPDGTSVYSAHYALTRFSRDASGDLQFMDCVTSQRIFYEPCRFDQTTNALIDMFSLVSSEDGTSLYAGSAGTMNDGAISHFARGPEGQLTLVSCVTSSTDIFGCTRIETTNAVTHFGNEALAISPDGRKLYASSGSAAMIHFDRDPAVGILSFRDCLTNDFRTFGCTKLSEATPLSAPRGVTVSPDGSHVYVVDETQDAVTALTHAVGGELAFQSCLTTADATQGCKVVGSDPGALDGVSGIAVAPGGADLYFAGDRAIGWLRRDVVLFGDGFETGDTSAWSMTTQ